MHRVAAEAIRAGVRNLIDRKCNQVIKNAE